MPFHARHRLRRGSIAALVGPLAIAMLIGGCAEDRSNLIPKETAQSLLAKINQAEKLAAAGRCFEAKTLAAEAQVEIEGIGGNFDSELKRSLVDGVDRLQGLAGDADTCTESDAPPEENPVDTEPEPTDTEGTTGVTGSTDSGEDTTGEQGNTPNEDQNSEQPQTGNGDNQGPGNDQTPGNRPTSPTTPGSPGSGGLGPG